ncbi:MAG: recombination-associated protein RdgC [Gammaproteobacteria bacterium]|jgi:recombination associated protein RdgC
MWFRNLQLYRLKQAFTESPEDFEEHLGAGAFRPCGRMDTATSGWTAPLGRHGTQLVHAASGYLMICARREEKIIPAGVVKQLLDERVAAVEAAEDREVYRRERLRMKEDIIVDILPRALSRITDQYAYIDTRNRLLVVDSASPAKAEALIGLLRGTLGRFPASPVKVRQALSGLMTRWLTGEPLPPDLSLGNECELRHPDPEGGVISCRHQDLAAGEVRNHIRSGKRAVKLALHWKDRLSCVLHEDLSIRRLHFEDIIREQEGETQADDAASRFDLDFSLMVLELAAFLPPLLEALGGEVLPDEGWEAPEPAAPAVATLAETA